MRNEGSGKRKRVTGFSTFGVSCSHRASPTASTFARKSKLRLPIVTMPCPRRVSVALFCLIIIYFIWMDIQLYFHIQKSDISHLEQPATTTVFTERLFYSPFNEFSVKLVMLDQVDNYIYSPLAELFDNYCDISHKYPSITPNAISVLGVLFACLAAFLVLKGKKYHRIAVAVFQLRIFCDALDGLVARRRQGIAIQLSLRSTVGFYADAVADSLGLAIFLLACYLYLRRCGRTVTYLPLKTAKDTAATPTHRSESRSETTLTLFFLTQLMITGLLWNHFIEQYHLLLEVPSKDAVEFSRRNIVFHSSLTWTLWWFWKISCGHSLTNMLLAAVYFHKLIPFLKSIQWVGLILLLTLGLLTNIHLRYASQFISK